MAFIDVRLAEEVAYGFSGGPTWSTLLIQMQNGEEVRNAQWLYPKQQYSANYENVPKEMQVEILKAFHACKGRFHVFRFKDWNDYVATLEPIYPVQGTRTPVQLIKSYTLGTETSTRLIQAVVSCDVFNSSGVKVQGVIDLTTGKFTPTANWGTDTFSWSGEFDVWVRFDNDYNAFTIGAWESHSANVDLIEVRRKT